MAANVGDPSQVPRLVADWMIKTAGTVTGIDREYLGDAISEVTVETQVLGASLLHVTVIDPAWKIQRSGLIDKDADGFLPQVDVNFPEGTPVWWRLAMVEFGNDFTQPNFTMIFQQRIISYLMDCRGPLGWQSGHVGSTRAQFIKYLVAKMPSELPKDSQGPGSSPIIFVCPEINEVQQIAESTSSGGTTVVIPGQQASSTAASVNKTAGLGSGASLTAKGQPLNATQIHAANLIISIGRQLGASTTQIETIMVEAIAESVLGLDVQWNPTYGGLLAGAVGTSGGGGNFGPLGPPDSDAVAIAEITAAFQGGRGYNPGALHQTSSDTLQNAMTNSGSGTQFLGQAGVQGYAGEAAAIVAAGGAGALTGGGTGTATSSPAATVSDVAQLTRGTPDNPDEDSWTCIQRLASEVNWMIFSSPSPSPGVWGNYLYYIDGPTLVAQKPSLYIDLSADGTTWSATDPNTGKQVAEDGVVTNLTGTVDNTAFLYQQTRKVKGRKATRTRIRTPQTPSNVRFNMLCGVMEFNGGDVFVFRNAGPCNGRWIVEDVTHNTLQDLFAQFTLGPPTFPYPEPQANSTTVLGPNGQPVTIPTGGPGGTPVVPGAGSGTVAQGQLAGVAQAAQKALALQQSTHRYHYSEPNADRSSTANLFAVTYMDCSSFATLCYKAAGLPDPNHQSYNPIGFTGSFIPHCRQISQAEALPGDVCFFGSSPSATTHMNVYIGNGQSISMGSEGEPAQGASQQMGPSGFLGFYRSDIVISTGGAAPSPPPQAQLTGPQAAAVGVTQGVAQGVSETLGGIFGSIFR